jgi:hypothetical protein
MPSLNVFWYPAPWERFGRKPGLEFHAILATGQGETNGEHVRSPTVKSVTRYLASQLWDIDQEFAVSIIEYPGSVNSWVVYGPPTHKEELHAMAVPLSEEDKKEFVNSLGEFLKLGQRLVVD